jgi:iron complex transport system permease protein
LKHSNVITFRIVSLVIGLLALAMTIVVSSGLGAVGIPPLDVLSLVIGRPIGSDGSSADLSSLGVIFYNIRLPRVILGCLVGMALGVAGGVFQALFRNPLADPYLIGVSPGASFGATIAIYMVWRFSWGGFNAVSIAAFCGALLSVLAIYGLSRVGKRTPVTVLILAGVALGSLLSACTTFLMFTEQSAYKSMETLHWLFGSLASATWSEVTGVLPYIGIGFVGIGFFAHRLNVLQLDEHEARALGINVERTKLILIVLTSLATAAAVSVSGIIGFVGLVAPHIVRLVWGQDHRFLLPMSGILGAIMIVLSDSVSRTLFAPRELPLGIVTALIGAPFFLYLLRKQKRDVM